MGLEVGDLEMFSYFMLGCLYAWAFLRGVHDGSN